MSGPIEKKYLTGLKFHDAKPVKTDKGVRHQTTERPLQPEDVLAWFDRGDEVVLAAADGRKHVVVKAEAGLPPGGATGKPAAGKAGGKAAAGAQKGTAVKGKAAAGEGAGGDTPAGSEASAGGKENGQQGEGQ